MKDVDTSVIRAESLATRRRVLFIAYLFPPISNSGTRRSLSFVNHLPDRGWEPVVLTVAPADGERLDPQLLAEVRSDTCIERVALGAVLKARRWASWLPSCLRERVAAGLSWRFQRRETVPDEVAGWLRPALARALVLHREQPFDVVYASDETAPLQAVSRITC